MSTIAVEWNIVLILRNFSIYIFCKRYNSMILIRLFYAPDKLMRMMKKQVEPIPKVQDEANIEYHGGSTGEWHIFSISFTLWCCQIFHFVDNQLLLFCQDSFISLRTIRYYTCVVKAAAKL